MGAYTAKCDICGTENTVASYGDWACRQCGQGYTYDECHQIRLTDSQWALLRNPPRWIPVGERLPEVHTTVLAVTRAFPKDIRLAQMASYDGVMWRFCDMDDDDVDSFGVTHWMPLPSPPEVK